MTEAGESRSLCQHCGADLLGIADAFCPECRGDLGESPESRQQSGPSPAAHRGIQIAAEAFHTWHLVMLWAALVLFLVICVALAGEGKLSVTHALWAFVAIIALWETMRRYFKGMKRKPPRADGSPRST